MAPNQDPLPPPDPNRAQEDELQEMEAVNRRLDTLSCVLDVFEQRTDNILTQLRDLLNSNREIRRQIAVENEQEEQNAAVNGNNADDDKMG